MRRGWLKRQADLAVQDIEQWPEWMKREAGMRRGKADRWDRLVIATAKRLNAKKETAGFRCAGCLENPEVAKLLRREHRAVVRIVTRFLNTELKGQSQDCPRCYLQACNDILDRLKARAR